DSGCVANFTASRVSTERVRKLRFFQPGQYISIDYSRQDVLVFSVGQDGVPSANPQISVTKPPVTSEEPLQAELRSSLSAVRTRWAPRGLRRLGKECDNKRKSAAAPTFPLGFGSHRAAYVYLAVDAHHPNTAQGSG